MRVRWGLSVPNRGVVIGAAHPADLVRMCELADASELFDAVFTGDNLVSKPRIDAIVFLALVGRPVALACSRAFPIAGCDRRPMRTSRPSWCACRAASGAG